MSNDRAIPTPAPPDAVTFTIMIDGEQVPDTVNVMSVSILKQVNKVPHARIMIRDGDPGLENFEVSSTDHFTPGKEIEILGGYRSVEDTLFKGIILEHGLKARASKPSLLVLDCRDKASLMTLKRKSKYFEDIKDSEAIEQLLAENNLVADVEDTEVMHPQLVQNQATDWDFIVSRAEANSQLLLVNDNEAKVMKPLLDQDPVLSLTYGATILDFEASIDARTQFQGSLARSWDHEVQEMAEAEGADPGFDEPGNLPGADLAGALDQEDLVLQHTGQLPQQELQPWADARLLRSRLAKIQGRVSFHGFAGVKPGDLLELDGVGDRFNGNVFISGTRHEIASGNWTTHAQLGLSPEWLTASARVAGPAAAGLLPALHGLQTGIVTALSGDPEDMARVRVRTPHISEDDDGIWARVAAPDAGDSRGLFFRPEISDEVVLGFMNDDPRSPVVLGMLHSSSKPAPIIQNDDNHEKGYVSREEMKLVFNDELKSIRVETPNGNVVQLSEDEGGIIIEDENGNKIQLSSDGITMEATADLNITSDGDVNIEGTNINLKANAGISAEGSASASVSSGGTTEIKGSLIQIN